MCVCCYNFIDNLTLLQDILLNFLKSALSEKFPNFVKIDRNIFRGSCLKISPQAFSDICGKRTHAYSRKIVLAQRVITCIRSVVTSACGTEKFPKRYLMVFRNIRHNMIKMCKHIFKASKLRCLSLKVITIFPGIFRTVPLSEKISEI